MSLPYQNETQVSLNSGVETILKLPAPARGSVQRLLIRQTTGTKAGYIANLYCKQPPANLGSSAGPDGIALEMFRVLPLIQVAAGEIDSQQFQLNAGYQNRDNTVVPTTNLYLAITPNGSGAKTFDISWTVEVPELT